MKSLKTRILMLVLMTLSFLFVMTGMQIKEKMDNYKQADRLDTVLQFYVSSSAFIQELQKERGKSSLFLNSKIDENELKTQKDIVDSIKEQLAIKLQPLKENFQLVFADILKNHMEIRAKVQGKVINAGGSTEQYSKIISEVMNNIVSVTLENPFMGLENLIISQSAFESAKENMGILRATMNGVLGADQPIPPELEDKIGLLKSGILTNLSSKSLQIDESVRIKIQEILNSKEWKMVDTSLMTVRKKAAKVNTG